MQSFTTPTHFSCRFLNRSTLDAADCDLIVPPLLYLTLDEDSGNKSLSKALDKNEGRARDGSAFCISERYS
jgi:hypothetical protein